MREEDSCRERQWWEKAWPVRGKSKKANVAESKKTKGSVEGYEVREVMESQIV